MLLCKPIPNGNYSECIVPPPQKGKPSIDQEVSYSTDDGLQLKEVYITAVCRCAPPANKPTQHEQRNCRDYLVREIFLLDNIIGIVALGGIAFTNAFDVLKKIYRIDLTRRPIFGHGKFFTWRESPIWLFTSYHPSRQNTQTGRLTNEMFSKIWNRVEQLID